MNDEPLTALPEIGEQELSKMMEDAIFGSGVIRLEADVLSLGSPDAKKVSLNVRWPDYLDEELITTRTNVFLRGLAPEQVSIADANFARARAMVEQLAVAPYPRWLQSALTDKPVAFRDRQEIRPDTSKLKVGRPVVTALYLRYVELYNRFHAVSLG